MKGEIGTRRRWRVEQVAEERRKRDLASPTRADGRSEAAVAGQRSPEAEVF